jgi:uncharacterized integral membrane protein
VSTPQPPGVPEQSPPPAQAPPTQALPPERKPVKEPSTWQPLLYLKIALLLFAIAYSIAFVVENRKEIEIDFIFGTANVRLIWEILLLLGIGLVGGILLSQLYRNRRRTQLTKESRQARHPRAYVGRGDEAEGKPR